MDYEIKLIIKVDILNKKNIIRDMLISQLNAGISSGNVKMYNIDIKGLINKAEDYESYSSPVT